MSIIELLHFTPFTPQKFGMQRFTLNFESHLEKEFRSDYVTQNFPYLRTAGVVAMLIWLISSLVEGFYAPWDELKYVWLYSLGIVFPIQLLCVSLALSKKGRKYILVLLEIAFTAVAIGLTYENTFIRPNSDFPTEVLHLILLFAVMTFVRFRFLQSLRIAFIIAVLMFIGLKFQGISESRFIYDLVFMFAALIFSGFASYALDYFARRNWMLRLIAEKEKQLEIEAENLRTAQELARAVAHEFNNPLGILKMIYELRLEPSMESMNEDERKYLEKIPKNIQRMSDLVQQLLSITELKNADYVEGVQYLDIKNSAKK